MLSSILHNRYYSGGCYKVAFSLGVGLVANAGGCLLPVLIQLLQVVDSVMAFYCVSLMHVNVCALWTYCGGTFVIRSVLPSSVYLTPIDVKGIF